MSRISEWVERMTKIIPKLGRTEYIKKHCPYKCDYFCDGKANKTNGKKTNLLDREPCKNFINGKCELELHKGNFREEV